MDCSAQFFPFHHSEGSCTMLCLPRLFLNIFHESHGSGRFFSQQSWTSLEREKPKRDWLIILQILNVNLKVTSRLHLAEKFWKKSKSTLQLGQSSKLTWINDSPQRKLIKDAVWQGCPSELTIYPYPLWVIFSVKPRVHNNLRILQENPFIISWVLWLRFKKTPNFLHGITMLQYSLCQNTSPPIQIQAISRWVPSDGGIRNCDPHTTLHPLNISAAP